MTGNQNPPERGHSLLFPLIFALLCGLYACGQIHRSAGGVLSPVLNQELGFDARELALIMAGLFLAASIFQIPYGIMLDRYGPRRCLSATVSIGVIGMIVFATAHDWPALTLGRILIGTGFCGVFMSSIVVFSAWLPPNHLTTWSGRITSIGGCGGLIATAPLAYFIEQIGWRATILVLAAIAFGLVLCTLRFLKDRPVAAPKQADRRETLGQSFLNIFEVMKNPGVRPMLFVALMMYTPMQLTVGLWGGPYLLEVHRVPAIERGQILFLIMACHLVAALAFGPLERRLNSRKWLVIGGAGLLACFFLLLSAFGAYSLWASIAFMIGIAVIAPLYVVVTIHCVVMFPTHMTGRAVSTLTALSTTGVFLSQTGSSFIVRALAEEGTIGSAAGYQAVFAALSLGFLLVALVYLKTRDVRPSEPRQT